MTDILGSKATWRCRCRDVENPSAREDNSACAEATENFDAYNSTAGALLRRQGFGNGYKKSFEFFEQSHRKDPRFALAYAE